MLDADKYEIGSQPRSAKEHATRAALRQSTSTGRDHPPRPDRVAARRCASRRASGSPSAPTSTPSRRATGAAGPWSTDVTLTLRLQGHGATVIVYKSMANGRSQRVDSATTDEAGAGTFDLRPAAQAVRRRRLVLVRRRRRRRGRRRRVGGVDRRGPRGPGRARHRRHRHHHDEPARLLRQAARPDRRGRRTSRPYLDEVLVMEQGTEKVADSAVFADGRGSRWARTLRVIEQGNIGGSGGYARGQLESVPKGTADVPDVHGRRRRRASRRASSGPITFGDLARRPTIVGGHMFSLYCPFAAAQLRRDRPAVAVLVEVARPSVDHRLGLRAPATCARARWLHRAIDVDFNGWFMCLIPRQVLRRDRPLACRCSSSGTTPSSGCAPRRPATPR